MGTDIHLRVEKFNAAEDRWVAVLDAVPKYYKNENDEYVWPEIDPEVRNYSTFAFLADVRNGAGFAGVDTGDRVEPQFADRGLPADLDPRGLSAYGSGIYAVDTKINEELREAEEAEDFDYDSRTWLGEHSYTHATLEELLAAPWDIEFTSRGIVEKEEYLLWKASGKAAPSNWCGMVSGPSVLIGDEREFPPDFNIEDSPFTYIRAQWSWRPLINCSFRRWLDTLLPIAEQAGGPQNVRVLMGFDS